MELLIVRHALAFERNARRWPDDGERPLSPRGANRARQAAAGLRRLVQRPTRVLTSPLVRARQTAAILTQFARWPKASECPELEPGTAAQALLALLARLGGRADARIALVGHEPDLSRLIAVCLPGSAGHGAFALKKMGVARLAFPGIPRPGAGELLCLLPPRALRAAARPEAQ